MKRATDLSALRLTYRGVLTRIADAAPAEGFQRVADLPELYHEELAAVIRHYPGAFIEALAEYDLELRELTADTLSETSPFLNRYGLIGLHLVAALRRYVLPLVLRDLQVHLENERVMDAIEAGSRREVLTADQIMADLLGLGRTLS